MIWYRACSFSFSYHHTYHSTPSFIASINLSSNNMTSKILSGEINQFNRIFWMIINIFFGGFVGLFMIVWVSCDMQMLVYLFLVLPYSLHSIFHVPWFVMNLSLPLKILFNACLFANFGFVHTFFAQDYVQESIIRWIPFPKSALRTCYLVLTNIAAWILMGFWQHTSIQLWDLLSYFPIDNDFDRHKILLILFVIVNTPGKNLSDVIFFLFQWEIFHRCMCGHSIWSLGIFRIQTNLSIDAISNIISNHWNEKISCRWRFSILSTSDVFISFTWISSLTKGLFG